MTEKKTICAISTARGGAIGIIRVSGSQSISITDKIFKGKHSLSDTKPFTVRFGDIVDKNEQGEVYVVDKESAVAGEYVVPEECNPRPCGHRREVDGSEMPLLAPIMQGGQPVESGAREHSGKCLGNLSFRTAFGGNVC